MSQVEMVLKYMQDNGSITTFESFEEIGCTRLPSRIFDLKKLGYQLDEEMITKTNRYGKKVSFKKYTLRSE